uniref:Lectin, mannose-binding 2 n=1 Tax=Oreochromis niloticus TaxID=8128 RepID=A0A669EC21_ORENI
MWHFVVSVRMRKADGPVYGVSRKKLGGESLSRCCSGKMGGCRAFRGSALLFVLLELSLVCCDITDGNAEHLKREHSLTKPYQGVGSSPSSQWDFSGSTLVTSSYVRLTPDERSKQGSIWNTVPCYLKDWEMHVQFKIHGSGKKSLHGDGIALWYTKDRLHSGPVFGNQDQFLGLAIFLDTFRNDLDGTARSFPYISAMGGCSAEIRNRDHDTYLAIRYSKGRLTVMVDVDDKNEWNECIDIGGVRLPTGYFFGASAATGDLSDNHDIISMKLYQLMVEHTAEEENLDWTKIEPSVSLLKSPKDNIDDPTGNFRGTPLTGWKVFLLLLCALLGIVVCAVVGAVVFQRRQERNKRCVRLQSAERGFNT